MAKAMTLERAAKLMGWTADNDLLDIQWVKTKMQILESSAAAGGDPITDELREAHEIVLAHAIVLEGKKDIVGIQQDKRLGELTQLASTLFKDKPPKVINFEHERVITDFLVKFDKARAVANLLNGWIDLARKTIRDDDDGLSPGTYSNQRHIVLLAFGSQTRTYITKEGRERCIELGLSEEKTATTIQVTELPSSGRG